MIKEAYLFKCPTCGGAHITKVEELKCVLKSTVEIRMIKYEDGKTDIVELPDSYVPGMPNLCDVESYYYQCATCNTKLSEMGHAFSNKDTKFKTL